MTEKRQYHKSFPLLPHGKNLLKVFATLGGNNSDVSEYRIPLLVDTGSTYTILPTMPLKDLGYNLENPISSEKITTGKGQIYVPIIKISWFNCVGKLIKGFNVIAYDIPSTIRVRGLLGMDFLLVREATIALKSKSSQIYFEE